MYYAFSGVIYYNRLFHTITIFVILASVEVFLMILSAQIFDKFAMSAFFFCYFRMQLETAHLS
jgi:hypothetical protein